MKVAPGRSLLQRSGRGLCTSFAVLAAGLLLAGCASGPPTRPAGGLAGWPDRPAPVSPVALSAVYATPDQREAAVERVAQAIAARFHDPKLGGVAWPPAVAAARAGARAAASDRALYVVLKRLAAQVRDSHTVVLTPRESHDQRRFASVRVGLTFAVVDGEVVVAEVDPGGPADRAGVRPGELLLAVQGVPVRVVQALQAGGASTVAAAPAVATPTAGEAVEPIDELLERGAIPEDPGDAQRARLLRATLAPLRGLPDDPPAQAAFVLQDATGAVRDVRLVPEVIVRPPSASLAWRPGGIAVLRLTRFQPQAMDDLRAALVRAKEARGLVLDFRGNGGGSFDVYRWLVGRLLPDERVVLQTLGRTSPGAEGQRVTELRAGPGTTPALPPDVPLAILIDARTASAAELAAVTLAEQRGALLVGEPTCGCATGVRVEVVLPDGGGVRVGEIAFRTARGASLERHPTRPQVRVAPTRADLSEGRDVALEEAVRRLTARLAPAQAASR